MRTISGSSPLAGSKLRKIMPIGLEVFSPLSTPSTWRMALSLGAISPKAS